MTTKKFLIDLPQATLVQLLEEHAKYDKQLAQKIKFALQASMPKKLASSIRTKLRAYQCSEKFIDYYASDRVADELTLLTNQIEAIAEQDPACACELFETFMATGSAVLGRADDSNGAISDVFYRALWQWAHTYVNLENISGAELANKLWKLFLNNEYGIYDELITAFAPVLKKAGLPELETLIRAYPLKKHDSNDLRVYKIMHALQAIADIRNSPEAYREAFTHVDMDTSPFRCDIAKRFIRKGMGKEALDWLLQPPTHNMQPIEHFNLLIEAYMLENDMEKAQATRWQALEETLTLSYYQDYLKHAPIEKHAQLQNKFLQMLFKSGNAVTVLYRLIEIHLFREAADYFKAHHHEVNGEDYSRLKDIAKSLHKAGYPLIALLIYRSLAEAILAKGQSKYYLYAASYLKKTIALSSEVQDWENFPTTENYWQDLMQTHTRKPAFLAACREAGLQ